MIPITLNSAEYLLIWLPPKTTDLQIHPSANRNYWLTYYPGWRGQRGSIQLPPGTWQIALGSWDMSEEEAVKHMEPDQQCSEDGQVFDGWHDFTNPASLYTTALQSAQSLFSHYGITYGVLVKLMK